ncbi:MAG: hypothetical protein ACRD04_04855 [Terriglobales bacterium]
MTLHLWLALFIVSMAVSAEVLAWAVQHGQFSDLSRGNFMPLRAAGATPVPPKPRVWVTVALWAGFTVLLLIWLDAIVRMIQLTFF